MTEQNRRVKEISTVRNPKRQKGTVEKREILRLDIQKGKKEPQSKGKSYGQKPQKAKTNRRAEEITRDRKSK